MFAVRGWQNLKIGPDNKLLINFKKKIVGNRFIYLFINTYITCGKNNN